MVTRLLVGGTVALAVLWVSQPHVDAAGTVMLPGTTVLVSGSTPPRTDDPAAGAPAVSDDGRTVAFSTEGPPASGPTSLEGARRILVRVVSTGQSTLVGDPARDSTAPSLSGDATRVAYSSTYDRRQSGESLDAGDIFVTTFAGDRTVTRRVTGTETDVRFQRLVGCDPRIPLEGLEVADRCGPQLSGDGRTVAFPAALSLASPKLTVAPDQAPGEYFDVEGRALGLVDFGTALDGQTLTVTASGPVGVDISGVQVSGAGAASFRVTAPLSGTFCGGTTIGPGPHPRSCAIEVAMLRGRACGTVAARLDLASPTPRGRTSMNLVGEDLGGCGENLPVPGPSGCTPPALSAVHYLSSDLGQESQVHNLREVALGDARVVAQQVTNPPTAPSGQVVEFASSDCALQLAPPAAPVNDPACFAGRVLAPGEQCTAYVEFRPTRVAPYSATVRLRPAVAGETEQLPRVFRFIGAGDQRVVVVRRDLDGDGSFAGRADPPAEVVSLDRRGDRVDGVTPAVSADGRYVAFASRSGGRFAQTQILVHDTDREGDRTYAPGGTVVASGPRLPDHAFQPSISGDGRRVAFATVRLDDDGGRPDIQVQVRDLARGQTVTASTPLGSTQGGDGPSYAPSLSRDGHAVAFVSQAADLAPAGAQVGYDAVYVRNLRPDFGGPGVGGAEIISLRVDEDAAYDRAGLPAVDGDGSTTAFVSPDRVVPQALALAEQVYVRNTLPPTLALTPGTLRFDETGIGVTGAPTRLTVRNTSRLPVAVTVSDVGDFAVRPSRSCATVAPGESCSVAVRFRPTQLGERTAVLQVLATTAGGSVATHRVVAMGRAAAPQVSYSPAVAREGQVTFVHGAHFLPGQPLELAWSRGPVAVPVVVPDETGAFTVPVVILKGPGAGPRVLTLSMPSVVDSVEAPPLLVVAGSAQPPDFLSRD